MTTMQLIAVIAIIVSALVALIVAHLQREQMRQIELYKQDSSVGLIPPSSPLTRFIKSKWDSIFAYGGPIYILVVEATKSTPPTRFTIFIVSFAMMMLTLNIALALVFRLQTKVYERLSKLQEFNDRQLEITGRIVDDLYLPKDTNA